MTHPDENALLDYARGALASPDRPTLVAHLDECSDCRRIVAALVSIDQTPPLTPESPEASVLHLEKGDQVGRYIVLEPLGAGAMSIVFAAYDPSLDRKIALKFLKPGLEQRNTPQARTRLVREAQALAHLSHPNCVAVFDAGVHADLVFIALELVQGQTLHTWLNAAPRTWRQVLKVYEEAGRGLAAAHAAGIIHRDFKPANVLVGDDGRVRVTDFGLARWVADEPENTPQPSSVERVAKTPLTRTGALMGTPAYMAPELLHGSAADARSDQFSFCVSLYEGLYGERPFEGSTLEELAAAAEKGKVHRPTAGAHVPGWVRRRVLDGLSANPSARYASVDALLNALRPRRRQAAWLVAGGCALAACGMALWLGHLQTRACRGAGDRLGGVWDAAVESQVRTAFEATGKPFAEKAWEHARAALDAYANAWVGAQTDACEATRLPGLQHNSRVASRLACLDRRLDELSALTAVLTRADAEVVEKADVAIAELSPPTACADVTALARPAESLSPQGRQDVQSLRQELARGRALSSSGKYPAARERIEPAADGARRLGYLPLVAETEEALGALELSSGNVSKAQSAFDEAVRAAEASGDDEAAARSLIHLVSLVSVRLGRPEQARPLASIARGIVDRLGGQNERLQADLHAALGEMEWQDGNADPAIGELRAALAAYQNRARPDTLSASSVHITLAGMLTEQGRFPEAQAELQEALSTRERLLGPDHPLVAVAWNALGVLARAQSHTDEEISCFRHELAIKEQALGPEQAGDLSPLNDLASALAEGDEPEEAEPLTRRAIAILEGNPTVPATQRLACYETRGIILRELGKPIDALVWDQRAVDLARFAFRPGHPQLAVTEENLAQDEAELRLWSKALTGFDHALALREASDGTKSAAYAASLGRSAQALAGLGYWSEARARLERALRLFEDAPGRPVDEAQCRFTLARVVWDSDAERALSLARQARDTFLARHLKLHLRAIDKWMANHQVAVAQAADSGTPPHGPVGADAESARDADARWLGP